MPVFASNLIQSEPCRPPGGGDWLSYYTEFLNNTGFRDYIRRRLGGICPGCWSDGIELGAVVGFLSWENRRAYIVPLCQRCSSRFGAPLALPADLMCVPIPADAVNAKQLVYPSPAIAYLRMQNPRAAMQWDGHPVAIPPRAQSRADSEQS